MVDIDRTSDPERLRRIATVQQSQIRLLLNQISELSAEIDKLKGRAEPQELALRVAELNRLSAGLEQAKQKPKRAPKKKRARRGHGPTKQTQLPVVEEEFTLDDADMACPSCGGSLQAMEGQFESSELVDVIEASYRVIVAKRQKYVCGCGSCVETALGPDRVVDGGRYSLNFGVKVAVDKYAHHLPLARQCRIMAGHGLKVKSQTLWDQIEHLARLCKPTYNAIKKHILSNSVIGLDQTGWPRLESGGGKKWQMWCLTSEDAVYHAIRDDKSAATFVELVSDFDGTVVCDALASHDAGARSSPGIELAGCWAHIYRKFAEAAPDYPHAEWMVERIGQLYEIDNNASSKNERRRLRGSESRKLLDEMYAWLTSPPVLTSTSLGKAIKHTLSIWPRLTRFADDPEIWLDNNRTERGIRGPVVGRRNHFGSKSRRGTQVAAIFYTLVETAKVRGVEPGAYLRAVAQNAKRNPGAITLPTHE